MDSLLPRRQLILETVSEYLQHTCDYRGKVVITKRNRDLVRGDFEIRAPNLGETWPSGTTLAVGKVNFIFNRIVISLSSGKLSF